MPELEGQHRHDEAERQRNTDRTHGEPEPAALAQQQRHDVHIHMPAGQQNERRSDEGRGDQAEGHKVRLPDRVAVQDVSDENHLADDDDGCRDQ